MAGPKGVLDFEGHSHLLPPRTWKPQSPDTRVEGQWQCRPVTVLQGDKGQEVFLCKKIQPLYTIPRHSPREANCLWRARRDCSLVRSSFMVISMWLALSELSAVTVCCGQEGASPPCRGAKGAPWFGAGALES